jgi:ABC-type glycerol-3-phosphate transport system permease component
VIASLPPFILYIIFQRQIVAGISTTGLAGR